MVAFQLCFDPGSPVNAADKESLITGMNVPISTLPLAIQPLGHR